MRIMGFLQGLLKRPTPLFKMPSEEIRKREILAQSGVRQLTTKMEKLATEKKALFDQGSKDATPEIRKMLAQQFEIKTTEQMMVGRELNTRSKEHLLMSRMRMMKQSQERAKAKGAAGLQISAADVSKLSAMIENDALTAEMYNERLDNLLAIGVQADEEMAGLGEAGMAVMRAWGRMDDGILTDTNEAFNEADRMAKEVSRASE